jgi:hypothetical protein
MVGRDRGTAVLVRDLQRDGWSMVLRRSLAVDVEVDVAVDVAGV